jgi:hypothetical protein
MKDYRVHKAQNLETRSSSTKSPYAEVLEKPVHLTNGTKSWQGMNNSKSIDMGLMIYPRHRDLPNRTDDDALNSLLLLAQPHQRQRVTKTSNLVHLADGATVRTDTNSSKTRVGEDSSIQYPRRLETVEMKTNEGVILGGSHIADFNGLPFDMWAAGCSAEGLHGYRFTPDS